MVTSEPIVLTFWLSDHCQAAYRPH